MIKEVESLFNFIEKQDQNIIEVDKILNGQLLVEKISNQGSNTVYFTTKQFQKEVCKIENKIKHIKDFKHKIEIVWFNFLVLYNFASSQIKKLNTIISHFFILDQIIKNSPNYVIR